MKKRNQTPSLKMDETPRRTRVVSLVALVLVTALVTTGVSTNSDSATAKKNQSIKPGQAVNSAYSVPVNTQANPPITKGPACTNRVLVLMDRSHSVVNNAGNQSGANAIKQAVVDFQNGLGVAAQQNGSRAEVYSFAFANYTRMQNGPASWSQADFNAWAPYVNLADPTARFLNALAVNETWYRGSGGSAYDPSRPSTAPKGYGNDNGTTNYEDAFHAAMGFIDPWGGGVNAGPDADFDMVLMVTDGVPTTNMASRSRPAGMDYVWSRPDDVSRAQWAVNSLRLGTDPANVFSQVRRPVPVYGVFTGFAGSYTPGNVAPIMERVFGPGNWGYSDYAGLLGILQGYASQLTCIAAKTDETASLTLTAAANPPSVEEGNTAVVNFTVTNTGSVALDSLRVRLGGPGGTIVVTSPVTLNPGQTYTFPAGHNIPVLFGAGDPIQQSYVVTANAVYDPVTQNVNTATPVSNQDQVDIDVIRVPLPS